jgi:hypothetical protein
VGQILKEFDKYDEEKMIISSFMPGITDLFMTVLNY